MVAFAFKNLLNFNVVKPRLDLLGIDYEEDTVEVAENQDEENEEEGENQNEDNEGEVEVHDDNEEEVANQDEDGE